MCGQISRGTGHNCPASIIQLAVAECLDTTSDLGVYERNMELLYAELVRLGFTVVKPGGTFYIFPKALEEDAVAFCRKAQALRPRPCGPAIRSAAPAISAWPTVSTPKKVRRSFAALERFVREEYGAR